MSEQYISEEDQQHARALMKNLGAKNKFEKIQFQLVEFIDNKLFFKKAEGKKIPIRVMVLSAVLGDPLTSELTENMAQACFGGEKAKRYHTYLDTKNALGAETSPKL